MPYTTVVSTATLAAHLSDPSWVVVDCRHNLKDAVCGRDQYLNGHIPGAVFVSLPNDLSGPRTAVGGRHPLPSLEIIAGTFGRLGISQGAQVVAYDQDTGPYASRLWWMLRWVGHEQVAVLDGGLAKWQREGRPVTAELPAFEAAPYPGKARASMHASLALVEKKLKRAALLDARAPARYRGEQEPIDPVAGRIPGAKNRFSRPRRSS